MLTTWQCAQLDVCTLAPADRKIYDSDTEDDILNSLRMLPLQLKVAKIEEQDDAVTESVSIDDDTPKKRPRV